MAWGATYITSGNASSGLTSVALTSGINKLVVVTSCRDNTDADRAITAVTWKAAGGDPQAVVGVRRVPDEVEVRLLVGGADLVHVVEDAGRLQLRDDQDRRTTVARIAFAEPSALEPIEADDEKIYRDPAASVELKDVKPGQGI